MSKTEMLRQLAAAKYNPPPAEEPPPPRPEPLPEPAPIEPPPASLPRPRKSQPPPPNPATSEQLEALRQQIGELIRQRQSDEQKTASLNGLAEIAVQMGTDLAKLSEEYRKMLPRIMDEPKQQTAAMLQEVRAVLQEMKTALKETGDTAQEVQQAARQVKGLNLRTWLGQVCTCLIVTVALLIGFTIWQPRQTREDIKKLHVEVMMEATRQWVQEHPPKAATGTGETGQSRRHGDKPKPLDASDTTSGSTSKPSEAAKPAEETTSPAVPPQWSNTNGQPPN